MKQIAVRVDDDLLAAIEATRGDIPRERWLRTVLTRETGRATSNAGAVAAASPAGPVPVAKRARPVATDAVQRPLCASCVKFGGPPKTRRCEKCGNGGAQR